MERHQVKAIVTAIILNAIIIRKGAKLSKKQKLDEAEELMEAIVNRISLNS